MSVVNVTLFSKDTGTIYMTTMSACYNIVSINFKLKLLIFMKTRTGQNYAFELNQPRYLFPPPGIKKNLELRIQRCYEVSGV
jgi:hypothetical protein